jgi:uncharacterized protein
LTEKQCEVPGEHPSSADIIEILKTCRKIAVVGLSPREERDSNKVARYLSAHGYEIIPVNPGQAEILGRECFKTLKDIPFKVDLVDLFLDAQRIPPVVEEAIEIGAKVIWMQKGISHREAADRAAKAGIKVVMNRCLKEEHVRLGLAGPPV